jgi:hypothetical protein
MQLATMLPGPVFFENLTYRWAVIVSRVICKYLPKFQHLQKSVITHIPHKYSSEMSEKSTVVTFCSWLILKINGNTVVLHWAIKNTFKLILKWNRFFNKYGRKGANLPLDLRMEQLNKCVNSMWRCLGANINEASAKRLARTTESIEIILDGVDKECSIDDADGYRSSIKSKGAVEQIAKYLIQRQAFKHQPGRNGYLSFPRFPSNLLKNLDYSELHAWMSGLIKTWESCYTQH